MPGRRGERVPKIKKNIYVTGEVDPSGESVTPSPNPTGEMKPGMNKDKVYRDEPCELLIKRSIDKLLAEHFSVIRHFWTQLYCKHLSWEIPELNHTIYALLPGFINRNESRDSLFRNAQAKHRPMF